MSAFVSGGVRAFVLGGVLLRPIAAIPQAAEPDSIQGTFTAGAQKVSLAHGLAWMDGKGGITVRFFAAALDARDEERARKGDGTLDGVFAQPNVTVDISLKDGAARPELGSFESCHVGFSGFEGGRYDASGFGPQCGAVELGGALAAGGVVHGRFKGRMEAFPASDGHRPLYTWDLAFTATLRARP